MSFGRSIFQARSAGGIYSIMQSMPPHSSAHTPTLSVNSNTSPVKMRGKRTAETAGVPIYLW